ncbi:MAG: AAA family ATPase [Saprospiraceae bacterium]
MYANDISNLNLYQPSHLDPAAIKENFIVRTQEFERIMDSIRKDAENPSDSVQHYLLLGRRGSGKSTLLKRIEVEIQGAEALSQKIIPINLAEEQAGITRLFDIFEVVLRELIGRGLEAELPDDEAFLEDALDVARNLFRKIHQALSKTKQRIVLLVDNIDKVFVNISGEAAVLREILLNYSDLKIIGASTRMSEHFWRYDQPFYQFFSVIKLGALSEEEVHQLLLHWSKQYNNPNIKEFAEKHPAKIKVIRQLTDGLPRTLKYFVQVLVQDMGLSSYEYLRGVMDKISPLYQERLNWLSPEQRKIVYNLAFIWEATEVGPLAQRCRMRSNEASAKLKQLVDINIVDKVPTDGRNHLYRLTERFFNLWLVMTQGSPAERRNAKYLTQFLEVWYTEDEIKLLAQRHLKALESEDGDAAQKLLIAKALVHSRFIDFQTYDALIEKAKAIGSLQEGWVELPEKFSDIARKIEDFVKSGKFDKAIEVANDISIGGGQKEAFLGTIMAAKNDFNEAEKYYFTAIEHGHDMAMFNLAHLYETIGNLKEAEHFYELSSEKGNVYALNNLGILYSILGRIEEAEQKLSEAIIKGFLSSKLTLINLYYRSNIKKQEALKLIKEYHDNNRSILTYRTYLLIKIWTGKVENLKTDLEQALSENGSGQITFNELLVHHQYHLALQAFTTFEKAEEIRQKYLPAYYALLELMDDPKTQKERLKIPPEIVETRDEIIAYVKERRKVYYPEQEVRK